MNLGKGWVGILNIGLMNILMFVALFYLVYTVAKLDERTKGLQYRLELIAAKIEVENDVLDEEVCRLLTEGKRSKV